MAKKTQKQSKLKPALLFAGLAGGVVAAVRKRSGSAKLQQAASQAAEKASDLAEKAKEAAPEQVKQAVDKVQGSDNGDTTTAEEETRRYAAPAEAGAQPPAESGGTPSDQPTVTHTTPADVSADLTQAHDLPEDVVMPDTSDDDPAVRDAEAAAAADAGSIGGDVDGTGANRHPRP